MLGRLVLWCCTVAVAGPGCCVLMVIGGGFVFFHIFVPMFHFLCFVFVCASSRWACVNATGCFSLRCSLAAMPFKLFCLLLFAVGGGAIRQADSAGE